MVLVACEESQRTTAAFRALGYEAYSCDIKSTSGRHPEWHIKDDVFNIIDDSRWKLLIAHPPCTYLSKVTAPILNEHRYREGVKAARSKTDPFLATAFAEQFSIYL